jgi:hypothetical protein
VLPGLYDDSRRLAGFDTGTAPLSATEPTGSEPAS